MRAAVVGAAGFIGGVLTRHLLEAGHDVAGYDLRGRGGVLSLDVVSRAPELPAGTEAVFFLSQSPRYRDRLEGLADVVAVSALGTSRALEAARAVGARFFCFASTGNVYQPSFEPRVESAPLDRSNPYALSKLMAEDLLRLYGDHLTSCAVRLFGVFGPGQRDMLPARLHGLVRDGDPIRLSPAHVGEVPTEGLRVSFTYVEDVAAILVGLAERALGGDTLPAALNVAGPEAISIRRFSEAIAAAIGLKPRFVVAESPREGDLVADIAALRRVLPPKFTPLSDAVRRTFR